jgi:cob(I)alamin adenosyltransferase
MVKLTKIYTKTGDEGFTGLGDNSRVAKTDLRIAAYADVDEANSAIGVAVSLAEGEFSPEILKLLARIQNDLFDIGADLATPGTGGLRISEAWVTDLEAAIDTYNADLPNLDSFIIPGGSGLAAGLHLARTVARRAERAVWVALEAGIDVSAVCAVYLNRLSDLLFVRARVANVSHGGDVKWVPAESRNV